MNANNYPSVNCSSDETNQDRFDVSSVCSPVAALFSFQIIILVLSFVELVWSIVLLAKYRRSFVKAIRDPKNAHFFNFAWNRNILIRFVKKEVMELKNRINISLTIFFCVAMQIFECANLFVFFFFSFIFFPSYFQTSFKSD